MLSLRSRPTTVASESRAKRAASPPSPVPASSTVRLSARKLAQAVLVAEAEALARTSAYWASNRWRTSSPSTRDHLAENESNVPVWSPSGPDSLRHQAWDVVADREPVAARAGEAVTVQRQGAGVVRADEKIEQTRLHERRRS